ncbi:MAG: hypothetical protein IJZ46_01430 [Bacilli bacterium]|nr:hypothetical protein [Bacilli bacterium]
MELKRDVQNEKLYLIDNDKVLLETGRIGAEFVIHLYVNYPIVITKKLDEYLYINLKELLENKYVFFNNQLSYQIDNKIVWFSDCYCDIEDSEESDRVSRLIIEYIDVQIQISYTNPFYEKYNIDRDAIIAFSPAGNGFYSRNINTGLTFQDDVAIAFYKTLVEDYVKSKKKVKK